MAAPEGKQAGDSDEGDADSNSNTTNELTATTRGYQPSEGGGTKQDNDDTETTDLVQMVDPMRHGNQGEL